MASIVVSGDTSGAITISAPATAGTNTLSLPANTGTAILDYSTPAYRNRIINGAMMIDQRNAVTTIDGTNSTYSVDRWAGADATDGVFTLQKSTTAPAGFINSLLATVTTADSSLGATQRSLIIQYIEGQNVADLGWGTANAQAVTLSFWVRSSLTGTFGAALLNSAEDRSYPFNYTISSANTWEYKTVTIPGDTSGTWLTTNGIGIGVHFNLGTGSTYSGTANTWAATRYYTPTGATSVIGTLNATFYITGVQLEKGSTATSFDYRPYGTELALCQRYFEKSYNMSVAPGAASGGSGSLSITCCGNINRAFGNAVFKVSKRADPTVTFYSTEGTSGNFRNTSQGTNVPVSVASTGGENQASIICSSGIVSVTDTILGFFTAASEL